MMWKLSAACMTRLSLPSLLLSRIFIETRNTATPILLAASLEELSRAVLLFFVCDLVQKLGGEVKVQRLRRRQAALRAEAAQLNKQAERLFSPASFAQSAKLSRRALALEKEAAAAQQAEDGIAAGWACRAPGWVKTALSLSLLLLLWGRPAAYVPSSLLWPLHAWLPRAGGLRSLGAVPFLAVSRRASGALAGVLCSCLV